MKKITNAWLLWLSIAVALTALINLPSLKSALLDGRTDTALILSTVNEDETRYLSRVHEILEGRELMGNPILKEHEDRIAINGLVEWLTAGYAILTETDLAITVFHTDILFSFLNIFLMLLWIQCIVRNPLLTLATFSILWIDLFNFGAALLRESHSKDTMLLVNLYLCFVFLPKRDRAMLRILRGLFIGLMLYSYPYHWTVFLPFEVLLLLTEWGGHRSFRTSLKNAACIFVPFILTVLPFAIVNTASNAADPLAWEDTIFRFGMLRTHAIAAPLLQLQLWTVILALFAGIFVLRQKKSHASVLLIVLLIASASAVASNILTGHESEFQGHYGRFVLMFAYAGMWMLATMTLPKKLMKTSVLLVLTLACVLQIREVPRALMEAQRNIAAFDRSEEKMTLEWLHANVASGSVILAPSTLAMLIPTYTSHSVFMSNAARFFVATDEELTERYLVFQTFFPEETDNPSGGTLSVFGNYAGSSYSRAKRTYQLTHFTLSGFTKTIPDFIRHQELRTRIDEHLRKPGLKDIREILKKYELDTVISVSPPPAALKDLFKFEKKLGTFTVWKKY
ncbi:hypothetical protein EXS65_02380 [Candidatus Peribacteria bacterium]|nr:hypothetical protein [Candidatus Peribacteria bacterium]